MSMEGLAALRARVHADGDLARRLRGLEPARFEDEVVRVAAELGCDVTPDDVRAAETQARKAWTLRWIR